MQSSTAWPGKRAGMWSGLNAAERASIDRGIATITLLLLGLRQFVHSGVTSGVALALALIPVCLPVLKSYRWARLVSIAIVLTVVWGLVLSELAKPSHRVDASLRTSQSVELLGIFAGLAVILWARQRLSVAQVGLRYGVGMLGGAALLHSQGLDNPWKFTWGIPTAIVVLAAAGLGRRRMRTEVFVLIVLAALSGAFDSRSYAATFVLAGLLAGWQLRPTGMSGSRSWAWTAAMMGALSATVYYLGTTLLVDGYLGQDAQVRSINQIRTSGSLILGGRPELAATLALMRNHLTGFGVGVIATPHEILVAKTGLAGINYDPNNGYVDRFLFGTGVELHSNIGDLWAPWGIAGLVLAVGIGLLLVHGLAERVAERDADALLIFLCCWGLWNLGFSPLYAAVPTLTLGLGLIIRPRPNQGSTDQPTPD